MGINEMRVLLAGRGLVESRWMRSITARFLPPL